MQLLIDTDNTPSYQLSAIIALLTQVLGFRPAGEITTVAGVSVSPVAPTLDPLPELPPAGTFGAPPANFTPPAPTAPIATVPAISTPTPNLAPVSVVTPALPATVPVAPPAPTTGATVETELDSARLPWDARINSEGRAKVADGTWRKKRGLATGVYDQVVNELRLTHPAPAAMTHTPPVPAAPVPAAPVPPPVSVPLPVVPAAPVTPPPAANPVVPPTVSQGPSPHGAEFMIVARKAAALVTAGTITNGQIPAAVSRASQGQLTNMQQLLTDPRGPMFLPAFSIELDALAASHI